MISQLLLCGLLGLTNAVPTPTQTQNDASRVELEKRGPIADALNGLDEILKEGANDVFELANNVLTKLDDIGPTTSPTSPAQAMSAIQGILAPAASPTPNIYIAIGELVANGLTTDDSKSARSGGSISSGENSFNNVNVRNPSFRVFPKCVGFADAPYTQSEDVLRAAIHIPSSFQYGAQGAPPPIILVPGTGSTGYLTFSGNYIKLLQGSNIADPVWLNIPDFALGDIQTNAEFVAYAVNYIYGISNRRKVSVATWSQGSIMGQWAYKYWPSTRTRVSDQISISPDYHGTIQANLIDPLGLVPYPPSVLQQQYDSKFIATLRSFGGDSAYVPTTNIYSSFFDEIVEPQSGVAASGFLLDARGVGATNAEVQKVCAGQPAGGFYDHETTLANPLGYALLVDALTHDGPGRIERINVAEACSTILSPSLGLGDFLATQNNLLVAGTQLLLYSQKTLIEPLIRPFAFFPRF